MKNIVDLLTKLYFAKKTEFEKNGERRSILRNIFLKNVFYLVVNEKSILQYYTTGLKQCLEIPTVPLDVHPEMNCGFLF